MEVIADTEKAQDVWSKLEKKYKKNLKVTARAYQQAYTSYQMEEDTLVEEAWTKLSKLGRRIVAIDGTLKAQYEPKARVKQLLYALPDRFSSLRDTLDVVGKEDPDEILQLLYQKEAIMNGGTDVDMAMAAYQGKGKGNTPAGRLSCYLCDGDHVVTKCPSLAKARSAVKGLPKAALPSPTRAKPRKPSTQGQSSATKPSSSGTLSTLKEEDLAAMVTKLVTKALREQVRAGRPQNQRAHPAQEDPSEPPSSESDSPSDGEDYEVAESAAEAKGT